MNAQRAAYDVFFPFFFLLIGKLVMILRGDIHLESEIVDPSATSSLRLPSVPPGSSTRVSVCVGGTMPATMVLVVSSVSSVVGKMSLVVDIMAVLY